MYITNNPFIKTSFDESLKEKETIKMIKDKDIKTISLSFSILFIILNISLYFLLNSLNINVYGIITVSSFLLLIILYFISGKIARYRLFLTILFIVLLSVLLVSFSYLFKELSFYLTKEDYIGNNPFSNIFFYMIISFSISNLFFSILYFFDYFSIGYFYTRLLLISLLSFLSTGLIVLTLNSFKLDISLSISLLFLLVLSFMNSFFLLVYSENINLIDKRYVNNNNLYYVSVSFLSLSLYIFIDIFRLMFRPIK